jgi:hypothetical protein
MHSSDFERWLVSASTKGVARGVFRDVVNETATKEKIQELVDQALSSTALQWGFCPNCRKRMQVEMPDVKKRIDGLVALLEQGEGKPEGDAGGVSIVLERVDLSGPEDSG